MKVIPSIFTCDFCSGFTTSVSCVCEISCRKCDIEDSLEEHETIIKAILNGEPGKADAAMQRHLHRAAKRTLASFEPH